MAPIKSSGVWKYFEKLSSESAKCTICKKKYSTKGRTTSALKNHLKSQHCGELEDFLNSEELKGTPSQTNETSLKQSSIESAFLVNSETNHSKCEIFDKCIAEMIALEDLPFSFVDSVGFKRLVKCMQPRYNLRGRKYFTTFLCEDVYSKVALKVKEIVCGLPYLSFTTDVWSEPGAGVSLMSLTCHGIDHDMNRVSLSLKCEPLSGSHTADLLIRKLRDILREWNIPHNKIHCILRDGGANIKKATQIAGFENISCVVHTLQLCVKVVLQNEQLSNVILKCKNVATHFNHSIKAQDLLKEVQHRLNQPTLSVIQDCPTRWNSTLYMLQRFLEIKEPLCLYSSANPVKQISAQEWNIINSIVSILKPFEETTLSLCNSNACISSVIPYIKALEISLERVDELECDSNLKLVIQKLHFELKDKFSTLMQNELLAIATYLDPRFKGKFFNEMQKENIMAKILNSVNKHTTPDIPQNNSQNEKNEIIKPLSFVDSLLTECLHEDESNNFDNRESQDLRSLLFEYENSKKIDITSNPLEWWKNNEKYSVFYDMVFKFLSAPPTTVASERLFSGAGLIYTDQRNRLQPEKAAKLLFIKYALKACNFTY